MGFWRLPVENCRPRLVLRAALVVAGSILAALFLLMLMKPQAVPTLLARLLSPYSDVPPYSPLVFKVLPEQPQVIYGGDLDVEVQITGGRVGAPVRVLTRYEGQVEESECFRGNDNVFSQKLEKIVRPVEFCFATGNARSTWQSVNLLLEPRFALTRLTVNSPAYTREPVREIVLGREEIKALQGSAASLTITSNRPLSGGELRIKPLMQGGEEKVISAQAAGVHTVRFDWPMLESATLEVQIRDVQGTPAPAPLEIRQVVVPDDKPQLAITEPGVHSLATPSTMVPVVGHARDDFGIRRVDFVRTLHGFRERAEQLPVPQGDRNYEFQSRLDLASLGVSPGEVIEIYLEGRDDNPALSGIQTSDVARIEIITEEEYGGMLRNQITLDELLARFAKIQEQLDRIRNAISEAREAGDDKAETLQKSSNEASEAAAELQQLARDFPAFDAEQQMEQVLNESAVRAQNAAEKLAQLQAAQPDLNARLDEIRRQFDQEQAALEEDLAGRDELETVGRVMEEAANFRQLVDHQRQLASWIDRMAQQNPDDADALASAARYQEQLRELVSKMPGQIREAAEKIPDNSEYAPLKADALTFADDLAQSGAAQSMQEAEVSAHNTNASAAGRAAQQAHGKLAGLLPEDGGEGNQFASLCKGRCPKLFPKSSMAQTLSQCLSGMMARGRTGGLGEGGPNDDGYATAGYSPPQLPVFGPQRTRMVPPPRPAVSSLGSIREGLSSASQIGDQNQASITRPADEATGASSISLQQTPEKYRSAVRRYFSQPQTKP